MYLLLNQQTNFTIGQNLKMDAPHNNFNNLCFFWNCTQTSLKFKEMMSTSIKSYIQKLRNVNRI